MLRLCKCYFDERGNQSSLTPLIIAIDLIDVAPQDKGPFINFSCDNGQEKLRVLWTDGQCSQTGGLILTNSNDYTGVNKSECTFRKK
jgi:hypothetical protein